MAFVLLLLAAIPIAILRPDFGLFQQYFDGHGSEDSCSHALQRAGAGSSVPSVSIAVIRDSQLTTCTAGSRRAWSWDTANPDTVYDAASLSKPIVAYAALRLVEQGRLDLDAPVRRGERSVTLRQLLSHTAGFSNALSADPAPDGTVGEFRYSGSGYILVGQEIERAAGQSFQSHMNETVLPELGMRNSSFGSHPSTDQNRALPAIDAGMVIAVMALVAASLGLILLGIHRGLAALFRWRDDAARHRIRWGLVLVATVIGCAAPCAILGIANLVPILLVCVVFLATFGAGTFAATHKGIVSKSLAAICGVICMSILVLRPAVPLESREQRHLAPAGLRTTASDYARFMARVVSPEWRGRPIALLAESQVRASEDSDWTLGLGLQRRPEAALWHWGVNFPGYQALAIAWPDGNVAVVLTNGGALSFSPAGIRYSGLESAEAAVREIRRRDQGTLWRRIQ